MSEAEREGLKVALAELRRCLDNVTCPGTKNPHRYKVTERDEHREVWSCECGETRVRRFLDD